MVNSGAMEPEPTPSASGSLRDEVKAAVIWRSGSQIAAQLVAWCSTLAVIRILDPADYGLFAMTQVVLAFLNFLNGWGFASALVQDREISERKIAQAFGMMLLVNGAIALVQLGLAPVAAEYYRQPVVADLLRLQALIFLATPFIALPEALLIRELDFKRPALANLSATFVSATVAITCALAGLGVWTLVYAPLAFFWTRALVLVAASRFFVRPSFRFAGAERMFKFGATLVGGFFFWTILTQADVFIAARFLSAHDLGLYAEALFLTTIIAAKFVPPLNEVAFPAYARIQNDPAALTAAFLKAVRLIMLVTCPLYFGLAVVADDAIALVLGAKWLAMAPLVAILAFAMPMFTLYSLFGPAVVALGRTGITMRSAMIGAVVMPAAFLLGIQWGASGLAWAWVLAFPVVPAAAFIQARGPLGLSAGGMAGAVAPGLAGSAAMAIVVALAEFALEGLAGWQRLPLLVALGGASYLALLLVASRETLVEIVELLARRKNEPVPQPAE
jgi:O-antigen/teichoic acid export membrane protein